jgi:hypothetical protein
MTDCSLLSSLGVSTLPSRDDSRGSVDSFSARFNMGARIMQRECKHCGCRLTVSDLAKRKTVKMESDRKQNGLSGFRFRCYTCPQCGYDDLFVDVLHIPGEDPADFSRRRKTLDGVLREVQVPMVEVALLDGPCQVDSRDVRMD